MIANTIIYFVYFTGLILYYLDSFKESILLLSAKTRAKKEHVIIEEEETQEFESKFVENLYRMLQITMHAKNKDAISYFFFISGGIGVLVALGLTSAFNAKLGIVAGLVCMAMPYLILRIKLQNFQVKFSREGEILITELLNTYKVSSYNIQEAIEQTAYTIEDAPLSKKMLLELNHDLTLAADAEEAKEAINKFKFSIGTSWGNILATNLTFAYVDGVRITEALTDLVANIINARKAAERGKRESNEANMMIKFLIPIMYVLMIFCAVKFFGFTVGKFFGYQLGTAAGMTWFLILIGSYVGSILVSVFLAHKKMDL